MLTIIIILTPAVLIIGSALAVYLKLRGTRLITCPETGKHAAVELDAKYAALVSPIGARRFRLSDCSRWPGRKDCGQDCLREIESSPEDCLVRTILTKWYKGKKCAFCGKAFGEINWLDNKPALMSAGKPSREWSEISPLEIPNALVTDMPVCFDCHIAETFRRRYPELVVDRPWRPGDRQLGS
jgi:hypothetical protein